MKGSGLALKGSGLATGGIILGWIGIAILLIAVADGAALVAGSAGNGGGARYLFPAPDRPPRARVAPATRRTGRSTLLSRISSLLGRHERDRGRKRTRTITLAWFRAAAIPISILIPVGRGLSNRGSTRRPAANFEGGRLAYAGPVRGLLDCKSRSCACRHTKALAIFYQRPRNRRSVRSLVLLHGVSRNPASFIDLVPVLPSPFPDVSAPVAIGSPTHFPARPNSATRRR